MTDEWIDSAGRLTRGKYFRRDLEDVAAEDPGYLRWVLQNVEDLENDDRAVIEAAAGYSRRVR